MVNSDDLPPALIAFQGGGALGMAHLAAWRVVSRQFKIIGTSGTSAGAIVAAFCAAKFTPEHVIDLFRQLNWSEYVGIRFGNLVKNQDAFNDGKAFYKWLQEQLGRCASDSAWKSRDVTFAELYDFSKVYLAIAACDLNSESVEPVYFDNEREAQSTISFAVRSSISIPGYFKPMSRRDRKQELVDGGLLLNFPVELLYQKAKEVGCPLIGVRFAEDRAYLEEPTIVDTLKSSLSLMLRRGSLPPTPIAQDPNYIDIEIDVSDFNALKFDLTKPQKEQLLKRGEATARLALAEYRGRLQALDQSSTSSSSVPASLVNPASQALSIPMTNSPATVNERDPNQVSQARLRRAVMIVYSTDEDLEILCSDLREENILLLFFAQLHANKLENKIQQLLDRFRSAGKYGDFVLWFINKYPGLETMLWD
jgi:predicted acylesterase/phospholipase RssA